MGEGRVWARIKKKKKWGAKDIGFARGSSHSILLTFFQSYVEHDLRKNKIIITFFLPID
jgi:hypothetical protein